MDLSLISVKAIKKMKISIVLVIIVINFAQSTLGHIVPHQFRTNKDIAEEKADRRMHPNDEDIQPKAATFQLKRDGENESDFWLNIAKEFVDTQVKKINTNRAKNVIFFLADGMSVTTYSAARVYMGGEEISLSFEEFPHTGMVKTYCTDTQVPDSSCSGTAFFSGVKANYGTVGVSAKVRRNDCTAQLDKTTHTESLFKWALDSGKAAGLVTTDSVTGATPSGIYAHSANRYWESDQGIRDSGCDPNLIEDIARQLVRGDVGSRLKVILGGGRAYFRNNTVLDEEEKYGFRTDSLDLIQEYMERKASYRTRYVWNATDLRAINANEVDYLLGLFEPETMSYNLEVVKSGTQDKEPTLSELTDKAIEVLSKNEEGYILFIEGQKMDTAHHVTYARLAVDETAEFSKAVEVARRKVSEEDTLIVVTADHSHTMTYNGYSYRGNDILSTAEISNVDRKPYMTLMYANGLGYVNHQNATDKERIDLSKINSTSNSFMFPTTLDAYSESHGGDDVAVFALGPWSHLFSGVYEQNVLPYIMAYASCVGDNILHSCT